MWNCFFTSSTHSIFAGYRGACLLCCATESRTQTCCLLVCFWDVSDNSSPTCQYTTHRNSSQHRLNFQFSPMNDIRRSFIQFTKVKMRLYNRIFTTAKLYTDKPQLRTMLLIINRLFVFPLRCVHALSLLSGFMSWKFRRTLWCRTFEEHLF